MKKFIFILISSYCLNVSAQTNYVISSIPYDPDPWVGATVAVTLDDRYGPVLNLPFPFCFYDSTFSSLTVGANGVLTFHTMIANNTCFWGIGQACPQQFPESYCIMAPWADLFPPAGGHITVGTYGVAPNRHYVISWDSVPEYNCPNFYSSQIILIEGTNEIEIHTRDYPMCLNWNVGRAIEGIQKDSTEAHIVPGRNYPTQWAASNDAVRFTPVGGACYNAQMFNSVSGLIYQDMNANCIYDGSDFILPNRPVTINNGAMIVWSDIFGIYSIPMGPGNYTISHQPSVYNAIECPTNGVYNESFPGVGQTFNDRDFSDTISVYCSDLIVGIGTFNFTRCATEVINVNYLNQGSLPDSNVVITVTLNDSIQILSSQIPYTPLGNNQYQFNIGLLNPGQLGNYTFIVSIGCTPVGSVYCINASITGPEFDCDMYNNSDVDCHHLSGACDPNAKYVASQNFPSNAWVENETIHSTDGLSYMIIFQNTGNDTAFTVEIRDTLTGFVDPSTVIPGASSHNYNWAVVGNEIIFGFDNILLPDSNINEPASHGFVKYRISQVPGNTDGTHILNDAAIYFDQNAPVITSQTDNLICDNPPTAATEILINPSTYCVGDVVTLTVSGGTTGVGGDWFWMEGDCMNGTPSGNGTSIQFTVNGSSEFFVHPEGICGVASCVSLQLTPLPDPISAFTFVDNNGTVNFTDASSNPISWSWDFGDGGTSNIQNPVHNYASTGFYNVILIVQNACGSDTFMTTLDVNITGIDAAMNHLIKVYPNPNSGIFYLEMPVGTGYSNFTITDVMGRNVSSGKVLGGNISEISFNTSPGYYILKVEGENINHTIPLIVE